MKTLSKLGALTVGIFTHQLPQLAIQFIDFVAEVKDDIILKEQRQQRTVSGLVLKLGV